MKLNKQGYTIIELLIAMLILLFFMIGLLQGVLFYIRYTTEIKLKDQASILVNDWSNYLNTLPYDSISNIISNYNFPNSWDVSSYDSSIGTYSFEEINSDSDNIPDFYDPYSGSNKDFYNDQQNFSNWLLANPNNCDDVFGTNHPYCIVTINARNVYISITVARLIDSESSEIGIIFGLNSWYFSPISNDYKYISTIVIRNKP